MSMKNATATANQRHLLTTAAVSADGKPAVAACNGTIGSGAWSVGAYADVVAAR